MTSTLHPASSVQRQFWLLQQLLPESRAYHIGARLDVSGELDWGALAGAFQDVVARHAALRTTFESQDGALWQRVHAALPPQLDVVDGPCSEDDVQAELARLFDLSRGPLLRARLWRCGPREAVLVWTMHHIVTDLAAKNAIAADLSACYSARRTGAPPPPPVPDEAQYPAVVEADRRWAESEEARRAEEYFAEALASRPPPLALPTDRPRPALQSHRGAVVHFRLGGRLAVQLEAAAARWATKPFLVLFTAYSLLLARLSGEGGGVVVGVPFTNRRRPGSATTVGCFVNTLPVPVETAGEGTFPELLHQIRRRFLEHHRRQELPLERIVARCRPARDPARNPLFQAGFTFEPPVDLELPGLTIRSRKAHAGGAQLDVWLTMWEDGGDFAGQLEYCADLFEPASVQRWVEGYLALLGQLVEPGTEAAPAARLPVMGPREREQVVEGFNATTTTYPGLQRLDSLLLEQAARTPDAVALRMGERSWSYRELVRRARALAAELRRAGVQRGDRVGVFMERSFEMVTALHATVLAGGAYVPLEPDLPARRIENMLEDAAPRLVLTAGAVADQWPVSGVEPTRLDLDALPDDPGEAPPAIGPGDAAYVIFTSGSTGRPKGVVNSHGGIVNRIRWMQEAFQLGPSDVVLQKTPFGFDVSVWEFFWPFAVGARLEIAPPGVHRDAGALAGLVREAGVTTLHFVPSMLRVFLDHPAAATCRGVRRIVCSGEALPADLVRRCAALLPAEIDNLYGPTEAAVDVSWWRCRDDLARDPVPIGKPIANTRLYVVDAHDQPVPIGTPGELHIGGVQVALGYVNRPDLTRERFLPDPFAHAPDARRYRTGDLARWNADGTITFLGRLDHQVKIRGMRIELGEIEAVLDQHPAVAQSVVVAQSLAGGDARLVAYVASAGPGAGKLPELLRAHAAERLPSHMVPTVVMVLDKLPLTASGKVDRRALPAPAAPVRSEAPAAPTSDLQRLLLSELQALLGGARVGVNENLFEAGATSLTAAQLANGIERRLGKPVPVVRIFEHPTVALLAAHLETVVHGAGAADATLDPLAAARERGRRRRGGQ
jgi:amino acid adenylation domain-containing protein